MRLSDLLTCEVVDSDGTVVGTVNDVRLVRDGRMRVDALIVGSGGLGIRLGYIRNGVRGPWLLAKVFSRLERRARLVDAADVGSWSVAEHRLTLRVGATVQPYA